MLGQEIGNWRIESQIGEGGMGTVYLARHKTLGTPAALKVLAHTLSRDPKFHERFIREARAQAQLRHPGIAQVMDFIEQGEDLFLVIEYLPGGTLAERLEHSSKATPMTALSWVQQALSALDYAHQHGVIHRDIKPSNLMFDEAGRPKVVDFGIALTLDGRRLTTTGSLGTPHYMSPEQIRRPLDIDHRTDVYAMGIVLYEMLAGHPPFDAESDFDLRFAQVNEPPKPLREQNPEIPEELEAIVMRALAKNPDERYSGCGEFARALAAFEKPVAMPPIPPPLPPPVPSPVAARPASGAGRGQAAFIGVLLLGLIVVAGLSAALNGKSRSIADLSSQLGSLRMQLDQKETALKTQAKLVEAKSWMPLAVDMFDKAEGWDPTFLNDDGGTLGRVVLKGKYDWLVQADKSISRADIRSGTFTGDGASSYLSVEATRVEGAADTDCKLLLRQDGDRYYAFIVSGAGTFSFFVHDKSWKSLHDFTPSTAIRSGTGQTNRLAVLAEGSHFSLFINDSLVAEVDDDTLRTGSAGISVGLQKKGDSARFEFDNFELRRLPS
ncbi:MAG TPA: serine/threonine-protein kinase [Thermoanaerobaculia bacterium]|nr:serine/threonine-protein kinase [Thermoanaerobaculia bacterium]